MSKWNRINYQPCIPLGEDGTRVTASKEHIQLSREAASECMVLLKNDNNILPIKKDTKIAIFGKASVDYVKGGGGSGDVTVAYSRNLYEGLKIKESEGKVKVFDELQDYYYKKMKEEYEDGADPGMTEEPELPSDLLDKAAAFADTAIVTICRFSGEAWDRKASTEKNDAMWESEKALANRQAKVFPDSDYCVTAKEKAMIDAVKSKFDKVIAVINSGGVIETSWIKDDSSINAALFMWQGGIEGGLAAADILVGDVNPSGKLADTFTKTLEDYPSTYNFHESKNYVEYTDDIYVGYRYFETIPDAKDKVVYSFGYGLSYTTFDIKASSFKVSNDENKVISISVDVTNTGSQAGKEVVMAYYSAPCGLLGKASKELAAFAKTKLLNPGENETITLSFNVNDMASYDDCGKVCKSAWVLEKGTYSFYVGNCVSDAVKINDEYVLDDNVVTLKLSAKLVPTNLKERLRCDGSFESVECGPIKENISILPRMASLETEGMAPVERRIEIHNNYHNDNIVLENVADGKNTLEEFMNQFSVDDLIHLLGGQRNTGVANTFGIGNMPEYGVPNVTTADGPAGLRIMPNIGIHTTAWPCATMLACSFNTEIAEKIGSAVAKEVKENNIGIWLAPAMNIHRTPMCGRNFEYFSEDPLVSGKMGAAVVRGVQSQNIAATIKHFAFNNKETNRKHSDSRVSERAAREIYLKGFEIAVKEASPMCVMTSYNKVNGIHCSENKELITDILRGEWGFDGLVMTDWWTSGEHYLEAKAGNDLKMANGYPERVKKAYEEGAITKDEIYAAAKNVLKMILKME